MHAPSFQQTRQITCLRERIVHAIEQAVLNRGDAAAAGLITVHRSEHVLHIKAFAHRQEISARGVIGRVQGQGKMHTEIRLSQFINAGHDAHGGDGDLPPAEGTERGRGDAPHGGEHVFQIQHRLAHAHEDDGAQRAPGGACLAAQMDELLHDLAGGEVALKARLRGGAEVTAHGAAHLAGNAARCTLRVEVRHQHRLHGAPVIQAQQQLRRAIFRHLPHGEAGGGGGKFGLQTLGKICGQQRAGALLAFVPMHFEEIAQHTWRVGGFEALRGQPRAQLLGREVGQGAWSGGGGWHQAMKWRNSGVRSTDK